MPWYALAVDNTQLQGGQTVALGLGARAAPMVIGALGVTMWEYLQTVV